MSDWGNGSLDGHCTSRDMPWSIIDSSAPNAHLAAVLAGFMVSAIVFLLRREGTERNGKEHAAKGHAIATFFAGVAVLGLDAYQFGSISSIKAPTRSVDGSEVIREGSEYICTIVWTQGMAASGMLAVGGALMIAGLGWTTTHFALSNKGQKSKLLGSLGNLVVLIAIATIGAALWGTTCDYFQMMGSQPFREHLPWEHGLLNTFALAVLVVCSGLISARTWLLVANIDDEKVIEGEHRVRVLWVGIALTGLLTFCGPLVQNFLPNDRAGGPLSMAFAVFFCVVLPYLIFVSLAFSVPGPPFRDGQETCPACGGTGKSRVPLGRAI